MNEYCTANDSKKRVVGKKNHNRLKIKTQDKLCWRTLSILEILIYI